MDDRSDLISKLRAEFETRAAYIRAKVGTLVPSQIRALRLKSEMPRQADLARAAEMKQSRISMMETPGAANMTLDTLSSIAAALNVGLKVEFVPFSEMLAWENGFSQDQFDVVKIDDDIPFLNPAPVMQLQHIPEQPAMTIQPIAARSWSYLNEIDFSGLTMNVYGIGPDRPIPKIIGVPIRLSVQNWVPAPRVEARTPGHNYDPLFSEAAPILELHRKYSPIQQPSFDSQQQSYEA